MPSLPKHNASNLAALDMQLAVLVGLLQCEQLSAGDETSDFYTAQLCTFSKRRLTANTTESCKGTKTVHTQCAKLKMRVEKDYTDYLLPDDNPHNTCSNAAEKCRDLYCLCSFTTESPNVKNVFERISVSLSP